MLTYDQITLVEGVYLALSNEGISDELAMKIQNYIYEHNFEQYVYLRWLISRWSFLKKDKHHLQLSRNLSLSRHIRVS